MSALFLRTLLIVIVTLLPALASAQGLRVGGPFDVTVSKAGLTQAEQKDVYLQLAQPARSI